MLTVGLHIRRRAGAPELDRLLFALVDQETVGTLAPLYGVTAGLRAAILPERCDRQGTSPRTLWILRSTSAGTPECGRTRCAAGDRPLGTPSDRTYHVLMRHDKIDEAVLALLYLVSCHARSGASEFAMRVNARRGPPAVLILATSGVGTADRRF